MKNQGDIYKYHVYHTSGKIPVLGEEWTGWVYEIYTQFDDVLVRESDEWFDCEMRATWAAIGHISLLEQGEG
jgi:hypothetical protein